MKHQPSFEIKAYRNGWEHIKAELSLLDTRINLFCQYLQQNQASTNQFKGLIISEDEINFLLSDKGDKASIVYTADDLELISRQEAVVRERAQLTVNQGIYLPLEYLTWAFDLSRFEHDCILLALASEYDRKYEKLFAYIQDDINSRYPTIDLALKLLCHTEAEQQLARRSLTDASPLFKYFIELREPNQGARLSQPLKLRRRIIEFFQQTAALDPDLAFYVEMHPPENNLEPLAIGGEIQSDLRSWLIKILNDEQAARPLVVITGPAGSGKRFQVQHLCNYLETVLLVINLERLPREESAFSQILQDIVREALLFSAIPCFRGLPHTQEIEGTEYANRSHWNLFLQALRELPGPIFLTADKPLPLAELEHDFSVLTLELGIPNEIQRKQLWERFASGYAFSEAVSWGQMASKFKFTPGQIKNALSKARETTNNPDNSISLSHLNQACFSQGRHYLGRIATKVDPKYQWQDIILPPETVELLSNACNQMKTRYIVYGEWGYENRLAYGRGLSMLFSGPPGTGKTMAAQVIARELNLELYRIDLAQVVSKYIGETEKNLSRVFQEAEASNAILFFDEADALFGKRSEVKDAHDRYSNIEVAYLLQKVEEYDGISILATNLSKNMDDAFLRRITFIVEFPFPDEEYRRRIWKSMFPPQAPVDESVDFDFLARRFEIAGGNIKNIVLAAAFLAAQKQEAINMHHLLRATKYEYQKIGRVLLKEDLGEYYGEV